MKRMIWLVLLNLFFSITTQARPLLPEQIPEPLKPWTDWVLQDNPELICPFLYNSFEQKRCAWPSQLSLALTATKGVFAVDWQVYQDSWIALPGESKYWPQNVAINDKPALITERNGLPVMRLTPGTYAIKGEFYWDDMPENLVIPADTGLISVTINGTALLQPAIKDGQLWLKQSETGRSKTDSKQNSFDLQVFRKVLDAVPLQVETRLVLDVSGDQRELKLALPLLKDFIPLYLQSPLPARLESDGQLLLQVRPGHWQIDVVARAVNEINHIALANQVDWPETEVWSFEAQPDLRMVEVTGLNAVDPGQTNVPEDWQALPAYSINQGQAMILNVIRRGDPEPEPNQLNLTRKLWLDFDGAGYTINDSITGSMTNGWRLNALPETRLGKVTLDGANQLITQDAANHQGVEVRRGALNLNADSRYEGQISSLGAVGWQQNFHNVNAELHLPPGWRLLATSGVDNVPDSWLSRWTLLDLFLVLITSLSIVRLWNWPWGLFALFTLALIWHEPDAPRFVWLNLLAATALLKVIPASRFLSAVRWYRTMCGLVLVLIAVPFMVDQVRTALYPQLEFPWQSITGANGYDRAESAEIMMAEPASAPVAEDAVVQSAVPKKRMLEKSAGSAYSSYSDNFIRIDPKAKVQTGPGLPQWQWQQVQLSWNGSVDPAQKLHLWYLSPTANFLLNFLRVIFITLLALLMFGWAENVIAKTKQLLPLVLWWALLPAVALPPQKAYAAFPDQALLDNLKAKLTQAPECVPACGQISAMSVHLGSADLTIQLDIHAQQNIAIPLPALYEQWYPQAITVDNSPARGLYREGAYLWLNVTPGRHQVSLRGGAPLANKFTLPLPLRPHRVTVESAVWQVAGLHEHGQADEQLQFTRTQQEQKAANQTNLNTSQLPPFVTLTRTLQLGLDWKVVNQINRVSPADSAVVLSVPLLPGEAVTTAGTRVKDGKVDVNMAADVSSFQWESTLAKAENLSLQAENTSHWVEVWKADISPLWHVEANGIAMIHQDNNQQWLPEWRPWPGEKVDLHITRPEAITGQTLTIDNTRLSIRPGQRSQDAELNVSLRSSQGGQHTLTLPEQAVLQTVMVNDQALAIRQDGRKLTVPVSPGNQDLRITWQQPDGIGVRLTTPDVDVGVASVNTHLNIGLGADRWVLFLSGPKFGPAVLFWGVIIVIALLSAGLGRVPLTPLKHWQWFLLLIGLSQIPLGAAGIVIAWLMLLGWRAENLTPSQRNFNAGQVLLAFLTLLSLALLVAAVAQGLLHSPDMQIVGNQSSAYDLHWYQDRNPALLPTATVISVPLLAYRLLMLVWSMWLSFSLLDWLKWGWQCFSKNGLWQSVDKNAD